MKPQIKYIIKLFTILITYGLSVVVGYIMFCLYLNDGSVVVNCTQFGESWLEYILTVVIAPVITYGTYLLYKERV